CAISIAAFNRRRSSPSRSSKIRCRPSSSAPERFSATMPCSRSCRSIPSRHAAAGSAAREFPSTANLLRRQQHRCTTVRVRIANWRSGANMKTKRFVTCAAVVLVLARTLSAHHSFAAEFDINKPVTLNGVVTKVEWANPHISVYLDVKDDQGTVQPWQCEGGPPNTLTRNGRSITSLKPNDQVTIEGVLAKVGSKTCNARLVKLPE